MITALFYPPHSLDPYEKPGERVVRLNFISHHFSFDDCQDFSFDDCQDFSFDDRQDLERMFAVSALFLQHTWVDWLKQCNPFSKVTIANSVAKVLNMVSLQNNEVQTKQAGEKKKMRLIFLFRYSSSSLSSSSALPDLSAPLPSFLSFFTISFPFNFQAPLPGCLV